jgi:predicted transcriptional regulator
MKKERTVKIEPDVYDDLREFKNRDRRPMIWIVSRAVREWLNREKENNVKN